MEATSLSRIGNDYKSGISLGGCTSCASGRAAQTLAGTLRRRRVYGLASSMRSSNDSSPAADRKEKATVDLGLDRALDHEPLARPDPATE